MKKLSDFLGRFNKLAQNSEDTQNALISALATAGLSVRDTKKITIRNGIATLKWSPVQKSEVALKQKKIIEELKKNPLTKNITVVR